MKIRKFFTLDNGVYKASLRTEDWSQADLALMQKFGAPEVDLGGSFTGPPAFTLSSNLADILRDIPFIQSFDARDYPLGVNEITTVADVADSLDDKAFRISDAAGSVGVVITNDGVAGITAGYRQIVVTITTNDSDLNVAAAVAAAIDSDSKFSAVANGAVVTVTNLDSGDLSAAIDDATDPTGFTFVEAADDTDADERADIWATEIETRICDAVTELRTNQDDFTREEVKTI